MTKSELVEPHRHKDRVRKVLLQMLDVCCGLKEEDFCPKKVFSSNPNVESLAEPELHEESFSEVKFFKELRRCMEICGLLDFGWKDLHAPTSKRFRWQLSAVINMAKFREDQLKLYSDLNQPRAEYLLALEEVTEENSQLNRQLDATQMDSQNKSKELMEVLDECAELEMEIAKNNKLQAAKREEATILKKKANDLKDEINTTSLALEEALAEEKQISAKVVSSPARRKNNLEHKRSQLEHERKECATAEEKVAVCKTKISYVTQAKRDVQAANSLAIEALEEIQKHAQTSGEVEQVAAQVEVKEKQTAEALDKKEECERIFYRAEEKLNNLRKQHKMKMDAAQESLEQAKVQLLEVEKERRDGMARVEAGEAEVRAMEARIEEETKRTDAEIEEMVTEFRETERIVLEQDAKFMSAIGCA